MTLNLNTRTILMVAIALIAAAATALMARGWLNAERAALGSNEHAYQVLVAKINVPAGHFLKAQDLRWQGWPKGTLAPSYVLKGKRKPEDFAGAVVRKSLVAGQPISSAQVVRPGEQGFLAAVLPPGMRAVSIQVNAITGISGFVFPGDRVDVVVTHTVRSFDGKGSRHVSETMMEDVRVLAVDQKINDQKGKASVAAIAKTVTFEVTPKQVEKIGIINKIGKIALSLRPIARESAPTAPITPMSVVAIKPAKAVVQKAAPKTVKPSPTRLAPISSAQASEAQTSGRPLPLFRVKQAAGTEIDAATIKAEAEAKGPYVAEVEPKAASAAKPESKPKPKSKRIRITMDSEVSRVLGRRATGSGRTVRVMRGNAVVEQKF